MVKIALGVEYDGRDFHGWQRQPNLRTVQGEVEKAVSKIADSDIEVYCGGRTDTGVHASGQVIHFETEQARNMRAWTFGVNSYLPKDVSIRWMKFSEDDFHARHSATARHYRYIIFNNPNRPALYHGNVTWHYRPLNAELMHQAAQHFIGEHDFTSFRAIDCQAQTPIRKVSRFSVKRHGDLIICDVMANAFLHHMVRNMMGVLMAIGLEKNDVNWTQELLEAKDRRLGADTAPPNGLYLVKIHYPPHFELPEVKPGPLFLHELGYR